ncbi:HPP family protein [Salinarchaeum laminariae]|uniref:HPP family protein n=1 Tax=Salinarchaeum laminariae TaxID=869888 RepID=UPI0035BFEDF3
MFLSTPRGPTVVAGLHAGLLFGVVGILAVATGQPAIFPSLGPTAYVLAIEHRGPRVERRRVIGGHAIGVLAGLAAYYAIAQGIAVTGGLSPGSMDAIRLAVAGVVSVTLTTWGMLATDATHPPACATTLIVSLGLLSGVVEGAIILASVVVLSESHRLLEGVAAGTLDRVTG